MDFEEDDFCEATYALMGDSAIEVFRFYCDVEMELRYEMVVAGIEAEYVDYCDASYDRIFRLRTDEALNHFFEVMGIVRDRQDEEWECLQDEEGEAYLVRVPRSSLLTTLQHLRTLNYRPRY